MNASHIHGLVPLLGKPLIPLNERIFFREPFSACLAGISSFSVKKNRRPLKPFEMSDLLNTVVVDLSHFCSTTRATVGLHRDFDIKVNRMFTDFHFVDFHIFQTGEKYVTIQLTCGSFLCWLVKFKYKRNRSPRVLFFELFLNPNK